MSQPWPGAKTGLYDWVITAGPLSYGDLYALPVDELPDTSLTVNAGDDFYVYAEPITNMLPDDLIGECNWIIEVSGGSADVELSTARDPGFGYGGSYTWTTTPAPLSPGRSVTQLPVVDRTYDMFAGNEDGLLFRVNVLSGSVDIRQIYLQLEPPGGLQDITGFTWSDYITPPTILKAAESQIKSDVWGQDENSAPNPTTYAADFSSVASSYLATVVSTGSYSAPAFTGDPLTVSGAVSMNGAVSHATGGVPDHMRVGVIRSASSMKLLWDDWNGYTELPGNFAAGGIPGRDFISTSTSDYEWDPLGDSQATQWQDGYQAYLTKYTERTLNSPSDTFTDGSSPHGEVFAVGGSASFSHAATGLVNQSAIPGFGIPGEYLDESSAIISPWTPPAGDITLSGSMALTAFAGSNANGSWQTGFVNGDVYACSASVVLAYYRLNEFVDGYYRQARPNLVVQMADYRYKVPVLSLSPDAIGTPVTGVPAGGRFIIPNPNLDGQLDEVKVAFAGTT